MPLNKLRKPENWLALEEEVQARSKRRKQQMSAEVRQQKTKAERQKIKLEHEEHKEVRRKLLAKLKSLNAMTRIVLGRNK
jgi:hypothetical protein